MGHENTSAKQRIRVAYLGVMRVTGKHLTLAALPRQRCLHVARSGKSGVLRGSSPFAGAWGDPAWGAGNPPVSFSPALAGRKETLQA